MKLFIHNVMIFSTVLLLGTQQPVRNMNFVVECVVFPTVQLFQKTEQQIDIKYITVF